MSFEFCNERLICKEIGIYQIKKADYYDGHSETRGKRGKYECFTHSSSLFLKLYFVSQCFLFVFFSNQLYEENSFREFIC